MTWWQWVLTIWIGGGVVFVASVTLWMKWQDIKREKSD